MGRGGIIRDSKGTIEKHRLLFHRGDSIQQDGQLTNIEQYLDVFSGKETELERGDVIIPESEDSYVQLWNMYRLIQAGDLVEPENIDKTWSEEARKFRTEVEDENEPPAAKKQKKVHCAD